MTLDSHGGTSREGGMPADATVTVESGRTVASPAMSAMLARNWWAIALRGVFALLFGVAALLTPGAALGALVLVFGVYMLVDGIFAIAAAPRAARRHERWGLLVFEGVIDLAAGTVALVWPVITALTFVLVMAGWAVFSGALMLSAAFRLTRSHGRWWMALAGVVSVIWGVLLAIAPGVGALVLTWWMGAYALFFGVALLVLAFRLRRALGQAPTALHAV